MKPMTPEERQTVQQTVAVIRALVAYKNHVELTAKAILLAVQLLKNEEKSMYFVSRDVRAASAQLPHNIYAQIYTLGMLQYDVESAARLACLEDGYAVAQKELSGDEETAKRLYDATHDLVLNGFARQ